MNPATNALPDTTPALAMIRTLGLIAALCGAIIVAAYQGTFDAVQENKRIALERAVFKVIPAATSVVEYLAYSDGRIEKVGAGGTASGGSAANEDIGGLKFYAGYDAAGHLVGIAAEGAAKGYADTVRLLFGYDPVQARISGFSVVAMRETPGIGDKVGRDAAFLANFPLDARLGADQRRLAQPIRTVKHGSKINPWEIDAIAGATITSRAVGKAIDDAAQILLPRLVPQLDQLREQP